MSYFLKIYIDVKNNIITQLSRILFGNSKHYLVILKAVWADKLFVLYK